MKNFKKLAIAILALSFSGIQTANADQQNDRKVTLVNTSEKGYMSVTYGFCGNRCSARLETINIYNKKSATAEKKNYIDIEVPDVDIGGGEKAYNGVVIHQIVEKELTEDGQTTQKVIAQARSDTNVCKGLVSDWRNFQPYSILELTDNSTPYVGCKTLSS